jgi:hypothetical protein
MPHKNGDRIYGFASGRAAELMAAGTPMVSSLLGSSITAAIQDVDVGDILDVTFEGDRWVVKRASVEIGKLTWSAKRRGQPDPASGALLWMVDDGLLHVERVTVNTSGRVADIGGVVTPTDK